MSSRRKSYRMNAKMNEHEVDDVAFLTGKNNKKIWKNTG